MRYMKHTYEDGVKVFSFNLGYNKKLREVDPKIPTPNAINPHTCITNFEPKILKKFKQTRKQLFEGLGTKPMNLKKSMFEPNPSLQ